jgi:hypothetical protein
LAHGAPWAVLILLVSSRGREASMLHVELDLTRRRARFVHDELVKHGWEVLVADAQRVKGLSPLVQDRRGRCQGPRGAVVSVICSDDLATNCGA